METVKTTEKVNLKEYERGASEENRLDCEKIEKIIEENYVQDISIKELKDKLNKIADSKCGTIVVETLGCLRCPPIIYQGDFEAIISEKETRDGTEEAFMLLSHDGEVGDLLFDVLGVKDEIIWDRWSGYFLVRFLENDIEVMISYLEYNF